MSWGVSTWAGIVSRSIGVLLPFLFFPASVSVLLVGGIAVSLWIGASTLYRRIS